MNRSPVSNIFLVTPKLPFDFLIVFNTEHIQYEQQSVPMKSAVKHGQREH